MRFKTTVCLEDVEMDVEAWVDPPEKRTRDYPGCDAEVYLESSIANGKQMLGSLTKSQSEAIKEAVLKEIIERSSRHE